MRIFSSGFEFKKHRRVFLLYSRFQTKHKCVSCLFWEMQWKTHTRFFFRLSNDPKKYTKKHEKNTSPTSVFQTIWLKYKGNRVHSCMGALVTSAAGCLAAASAMSKKKIKTLRPTQNPDTEPIHAKNNRFHSNILIFDNYPKSKTKKLTLLTCSYLFHNFNPKSYNSRYKTITKLKL